MMARCKANTKFGQPCEAKPRADGYCFFHGDPNKASQLGRAGGMQNRRHVVEPIEIPNGMALGDLRQKTEEVMRLLLKREISPQQATAFVQLSAHYQKFLPAEEMGARVEVLEQQVAELLVAKGSDLNSALSKTNCETTGKMRAGAGEHLPRQNGFDLSDGRELLEPDSLPSAK
jgi:hypothetical protein